MKSAPAQQQPIASVSDPADAAARVARSPAERLTWLAAIQHDKDLAAAGDAPTVLIVRAVAAVLATAAVSGAGRCWLSVASIAALAGCSPRAARGAIARLAKRGHIKITGRTKPGTREHDSNIYHLTWRDGAAPGAVPTASSAAPAAAGGTEVLHQVQELRHEVPHREEPIEESIGESKARARDAAAAKAWWDSLAPNVRDRLATSDFYSLPPAQRPLAAWIAAGRPSPIIADSRRQTSRT